MDELSLGLLGALLLLGLILVLIEFFLVPGSTIIGVIGLVIMAIAVAFAFKSQGNKVGLLFLSIGFLSALIALWFGIRLYRSRKLSVNAQIDSRSYLQEETVEIGAEGISISDLRPGGRARFGDKKLEVYAQDAFVEKGTAIEVIAIENHKIFVQIK